MQGPKYYERLHGLLDALSENNIPAHQLVVMGGEANFLFAYTPDVEHKLERIPPEVWQLPEMNTWTEDNIKNLLDVAESALKQCVSALNMPVSVLRKSRAVGIYPPAGVKLAREQLEETVLVTQRILEMSSAGKKIPFCAFNGGNDVFVDIGDKSWGVMACQRYFGGIEGGKSLHVGDQFLSAGANDFKVSGIGYVKVPCVRLSVMSRRGLLAQRPGLLAQQRRLLFLTRFKISALQEVGVIA